MDEYWVRLGNFQALRGRGQFHLGARVCRLLNGGADPDQVSSALQDSGWATPVINDWAQFARCVSDLPTAVPAALTAYRIGVEKVRPWQAALLARHVCDAYLLAGSLKDAVEWAETARQHAIAGLRLTEGVPAAETMEAVNDAAAAAIKLAALMEGTDGVERELGLLAETHARQRRVLEDLNRGNLVMPIPGPAGPVDRELLLDGWPAAVLALLRGEAGTPGACWSTGLRGPCPRSK